MSEQIALMLPADVYRQAEIVAHNLGRPVDELIAETIRESLPPFENVSPSTPPAQWSDEEVLANTNLTMPDEAGQRLSELLAKQREGELVGNERKELLALMAGHQRLLLRKARALAEAVRRGLRGPVAP